MTTKRVHAAHHRRKVLIKVVILVLLLIAAFCFVKARKEALVREGTNFLQTLLSRESDMQVKIGKISGKLSGVVRFDDVSLEDPDMPAGLKTLFRAERVEFRYQWIDFLSKQFKSKIVVTLIRPEAHWRPRIQLRTVPMPVLESLRNLLLTQRKRLELNVKDLKLFLGDDSMEVSPIQAHYDDDRFEVSLPVRHLLVYGNDISTEVNIKGHLEWGLLKAEDSVIGQVFTEGTIINWKPYPAEARADFVMTRTQVNLDTSSILGGLEASGSMELNGDPKVNIALKAKDYPLKNLEPFFARSEAGTYDGFLDLYAHFQGPVDTLSMEADASIHGGKGGGKHYQALNLHLKGVYPTLNLHDSQMLMEDGALMRFADKSLEFNDLFSGRTYRQLIAGSDQETVSMGDWAFSRPVDSNQMSEFLVERSLGKHASLQLRKFNEPEEKKLDPQDTDPTNELEVGFAYHLRSKDSIQYRVREDEQFLGVERKMSF